MVWVYDQARWRSDNPGARTLAMMRNINDLNTGRKLGALRVDILSGALGGSFGNYINNPLSVTYMVDAEGKILASQPEVQGTRCPSKSHPGLAAGMG